MSDPIFSPNGQRLLKYLEGLRLTSYIDTGGNWTVGYGHTGPDVRPGMRITQEQAEILFWRDVAVCATAINDNNLNLTQDAYDAITCFIFNVGPTGFASSSPCAWLKRGNYEKAAESMLLWNKSRKGEKGPLVFDAVLDRRRRLEARLLLGDIPREARGP